ncbi:sulfate ABC transporter substrate-binding protein [Nocardioides mesophilus]|uniref:Sulfate ABC transporter substrate-binding protein n=1 Tax=Nocardioides mesophilus TaxID=433659 RepID=A0A7G9R6S7_9ACTN|nr:sulfate ABC transporter substrate-binding protein [Nocardioides mesophilus]QNN51302.1 sulfate ABC transporter substrate-binding protein [Nocardioides mesophilus]
MRASHLALAGTAITAMLTLSACGGASAESGSQSDEIKVVGYSVLEQANTSVIKDFQATTAGKDVKFTTSYGASGDQSRAVEAGQDADEVHFSLEPDVTRLVDAGLVAPDWKDNDTAGICTQSVVVLVVRPGNPLGIKTWADLVKPGVGIVTPNPASSGSAKWNLLAAYGHVLATGGTEKEAEAYIGRFFDNTVALPDSGRDATTAFESGNGDVLLSYENEAILARQSGADFDYVVPEQTLLIENPCAVTEDASDAAQEFLDYQKSAEGQKAYAATGYRPLVDTGDVEVEGANDPADPFPTPATLQTIDGDFGGWGEANTEFFDENDGILTKLQAAAGQ